MENIKAKMDDEGKDIFLWNSLSVSIENLKGALIYGQ